MPFAAISSQRYVPSGPSIAWCACAAERKANGTCCTSAAGTMVPRMPPISVKNWMSPATSAFSAAGSLPWMLLFCGNTCTSTRPRVSMRTASHISTIRLWSELAGVWLWYWLKVKSAWPAARSERENTVSEPRVTPTKDRRVSGVGTPYYGPFFG